GRGGGSLEDLWAFNDERVARAIAAARVPVVSAVGHERDVTIADLVADRRAPTPTAAAAMVVPDHRHLLARFDPSALAMRTALRRQIQGRRDRVAMYARHLGDPRHILKSVQLRIDELSERVVRATIAAVRADRQVLRGAAERLQALSPLAVLQ